MTIQLSLQIRNNNRWKNSCRLIFRDLKGNQISTKYFSFRHISSRKRSRERQRKGARKFQGTWEGSREGTRQRERTREGKRKRPRRTTSPTSTWKVRQEQAWFSTTRASRESSKKAAWVTDNWGIVPAAETSRRWRRKNETRKVIINVVKAATIGRQKTAALQKVVAERGWRTSRDGFTGLIWPPERSVETLDPASAASRWIRIWASRSSRWRDESEWRFWWWRHLSLWGHRRIDNKYRRKAKS